MRFIIIVFITFSSISSFCQKKKDVTDINKWINAVINIDSKSDLYEKVAQKILGDAFEKVKKKEITEQRYSYLNDSLRSASPISTGTAIFLKYKSKRYLLTARHVVMDTQSSLKDSVLFDYIRRIPLENENITKDDKYFGKINVQLPNEGTYIFGSNEIDIAIISLDTRNADFADFLESRKHVPISIDDIDTLCKIDHGQDIMCVGYPFYSFEGLQGISHRFESYFKSRYVADVSTTFGKIAVTKYHDHFFIGDINIMPGNSGGAIVSGNKLIGIVLSQPVFYIADQAQQPMPYTYRLPLAVNIKSSEIMPLLHKLRRNLGDE